MSDMSAPRHSPPPTAHEQHDVLLIAQLVAGDPIDDAQRLDAQRLLVTCQACAALAGDLGIISRAVAWEPIPPRRRDFRFDAQRAAELRGSRLQRLLSKLSLPQAAVLRPLAAGVMSVGLLFVVAGTVWPQAGSQTPATPLTSPSPALMMEAPAEALPTGIPDAPAAGSMLEQMSDGEANASRPAASAVPETSAEDAYALDAAPQAEQGLQYAGEAEPGAVEEAERAKALRSEAAGTLAPEGLAAESQPVAEPRVAAEPQPTPELERILEPQPTPELERTLELQATPELQPTADETSETVASETGTDIDAGTAVEDLLLAVGLILAVAGAMLLLLVWLGRRIRDPLLR